MIITWIRQFCLASGMFALLVTTFSLSMSSKEKQLAQKQLSQAHITVKVKSTTPQINLN